MKDLQMTVSLQCSICGNDQFLAVDERIQDIKEADDNVEVKCSDCGRVTTKEELLEENSHIIDGNIEDFKDEIIKNIRKDFEKMLK